MPSLEYMLLGLTPLERWSAAQSARGSFLTESWFVLTATAVLVLLVILLLWIGHSRRSQQHRQTQEQFSETATRRGLSLRERQILLAVVMRSGLVRSQDIFTTAQAFERGVTRLMAECARNRTTEENERLNAEIVYLREKLGFPLPWVPGAPIQSRRPSSRDILEGRRVEATRRTARGTANLHATVVRNDDIELVIELEKAVESRPGEFWRVRYSFGTCVWEFDSLAVRGEGKTLVLTHSDQVRFINRRRFPRVEVDAAALVAAFPFIGCAPGGLEGGLSVLEGPRFFEARVVELAGPGLRIRTSLPARAGERILVIFRIPDNGGPGRRDDAEPQWRIIGDIGQVKHCKTADGERSIAVELAGLSEAGLDELVRLTNQAAAAARLRAQRDDPTAASDDERPTRRKDEASVMMERA